MDNTRLINIETKLAYQEHMVSELNQVIIEQQADLDELKKTTRALTQRISEMSEDLTLPDRGSEKPPHY